MMPRLGLAHPRLGMAAGAPLDRPGTAQDPAWKHHNTSEKPQYAVDGDADDPEWQHHHPDEWIKDHCQQRNRPAHDQQDAPEQ